MKIAWFTPFSDTSAIGRFSRLVAEELARSHDIDIWHPPARHLQPTRLRTVALPPGVPVDSHMLAVYDLPVYNLGDHLPAHRDIWLASQAAPGITILHDFVMHHFFAGYYINERNSPAEYIAALARWYGEPGRTAAERKAPPLWETNDVMDFPLFEEAVRRAHAVVVHSDFLRRKVEEAFPGAVRKLWLPYDYPAAPAPASRAQLGVPEGRTLLVTVGQVNPNKRIASVIETLACNPELRACICYAVLGACDDKARSALEALAGRHGMEDTVRITGYLPEERLRAWLARADVFVNLRYPAMEGGSASLAEEMLAGKPVVVSDTGVYAELPDDCVAKVRPEYEAEDLAAALTRLADPSARKALARRALEFARLEFRPAKYAAGLLELAAGVLEAKPILDVVDRMADRITQLGVTPDAELVQRLAAECDRLFCARKGSA